MEQPEQLRFIVFADGGEVVADELFSVISHEALMIFEEKLAVQYTEPFYGIIRTDRLEVPAKKIIEAAARGEA
jgi:hypothetical protein